MEVTALNGEKIQKGINKNEQAQGIEISNKQIEILARHLSLK